MQFQKEVKTSLVSMIYIATKKQSRELLQSTPPDESKNSKTKCICLKTCAQIVRHAMM